MTLLLAEDLLLLLLDDRTGTTAAIAVDEVLGGALLTELALTGAVVVGERGSWGRSGRVTLTAVVADPAGPAAHPVLGAAIARVAERPRSAQDLVGVLGRGLREPLCQALAARGLLRRTEERVLGLFPRTRWPAADVRYEAAMRERLLAVLVHGAPPDPRSVALLALVAAVDRLGDLMDGTGLPRGEAKRRVRALSAGSWAAEAVRQSVDATTAAMIAVLTVTMAAATS
jgi:hypothetical protein